MAALFVAMGAVTFKAIRLELITRVGELDVAALLETTRNWRRPFLWFGTV